MSCAPPVQKWHVSICDYKAMRPWNSIGHWRRIAGSSAVQKCRQRSVVAAEDLGSSVVLRMASGKQALIVADVQNGITDMYFKENEAGLKEYVAKLNTAIAAARKQGHLIVFVRVAFREGHPEIPDDHKVRSIHVHQILPISALWIQAQHREQVSRHGLRCLGADGDFSDLELHLVRVTQLGKHQSQC